ncbi:MAG TPA: helix-turn-helix domain-containing protein [Candidatus Binatia bacterium]|nr:helix-turn-helix domain-containing protein [Candidatus Binatia bacterium]
MSDEVTDAAERLSLEEREEIALGLCQGQSVRGLARHLGRSPTTVCRETRRRRRRGCSVTERGRLPPPQGLVGPALDRRRQRNEHHPGGGDVGQGDHRGWRPENSTCSLATWSTSSPC